MSPELRKIAAAADERFPKLKGHGERVASFAVTAAHSLGVSQTRLRSLRIACALHYSWAESGDRPCCQGPAPEILRWSLIEDRLAEDFIRAMYADWNMAPLESSVLAAACHLDLAKMGFPHKEAEYRPGIREALSAIENLITPLDYVQRDL